MVKILKNTEKYSNIRLVRGKNLQDYLTSHRVRSRSYQTLSGVSTQKYQHVWFNLEEGRAIFKTFDLIPQSKKNRIVNELVCQELAKQLGIKCAVYKPAYKSKDVGLVSYDVAGEQMDLYTGKELCTRAAINTCSNTISQYVKAIKFLSIFGMKTNDKQILLDLYKICVFDYLTMQSDRHRSNVFFIKDKKTDTLKVAPLIDNELAFCGNCLEQFKQLSEITNEHIIYLYERNSSYLSIYKDKPSDFEARATEIVSFAKRNKITLNILEQYLSKINITKAIESVEKMGFKINDGYKEYLKNIISLTKRTLKKELKRQSSIEDVKE